MQQQSFLQFLCRFGVSKTFIEILKYHIYIVHRQKSRLFTLNIFLLATLFLEMWKRYSAEITHRWDLTGFDIQEEHPRPEYLARLAHVKRKQVNVITNTMEPHVPFWKIRVPMTIFSFSIVILLVGIN